MRAAGNGIGRNSLPLPLAGRGPGGGGRNEGLSVPGGQERTSPPRSSAQDGDLRRWSAGLSGADLLFITTPTPRPPPRKGEGEAAHLRGLSPFAAVIALTLAAAVFPAAAQDLSTPGARAYYVHGCYGCHGFDGKSRLRPLDAAVSPILQSEEVFLAFLRLRADQNPLLPSTAMPNYPETSLSDANARAIYAHILSLQSEDPAVEDVPLFRALLEEAGAQGE